jgi:hypothetical protein
MTWKNLILVPFLALMPAIVGCGADCEDVCEKGNECEGEDDNCGDLCEDAEALNEKAGCEDSFDEFVSCMDDADDVCSTDLASQPCKSEITAYSKCVTTYCSSHQNDSDCILG